MTERDDDNRPLSSEDLVARARQESRGNDSDKNVDRSSVVDSPLPESPDDTLEDYAEFLRQQRAESSLDTADAAGSSSEEMIAEATTGNEAAIDSAPDGEPTADAQPTVPNLSDEELDEAWGQPASVQEPRQWDPHWLPDTAGTNEPVGGPDPSVLSPQTQRPGQTAGRSTRWIVSLLIVGGYILFSSFGSGMFESGTAVDDLAYGDCLVDPGADEFSGVEVVECADPHHYEVVADVEVAGTDYPGEQNIVFAAFEDCTASFAAYIGVPYLRSRYEIEVLFPSESAWDAGDNTVTCVAYEPIGSGYEPRERRGSLRNVGR